MLWEKHYNLLSAPIITLDNKVSGKIPQRVVSCMLLDPSRTLNSLDQISGQTSLISDS